MKEEKINPNDAFLGNIVKFTEEDVLRNKKSKFDLCCTFDSYMIGQKNDSTGIPLFFDIINQYTEPFYYFSSLEEARKTMGEDCTKPFVIDATLPIAKLGVLKDSTRREIVNTVSKHDLKFNFVDTDDNSINKKRRFFKKK